MVTSNIEWSAFFNLFDIAYRKSITKFRINSNFFSLYKQIFSQTLQFNFENHYDRRSQNDCYTNWRYTKGLNHKFKWCGCRMDHDCRYYHFLYAIRICFARIWKCQIQKPSKYFAQKLYGRLYWCTYLVDLRIRICVWSLRRWHFHRNKIFHRTWTRWRWCHIWLWLLVLPICFRMHSCHDCFRFSSRKSQHS